MAKIKAGTYQVREVLRIAKFDFEKEAAAEYLSGAPDHRRVQIGGLSFDSVDEVVVIPETADSVSISLDGEEAISLSVSLDAEQKKIRDLSFEIAAENAKDNK